MFNDVCIILWNTYPWICYSSLDKMRSRSDGYHISHERDMNKELNIYFLNYVVYRLFFEIIEHSFWIFEYVTYGSLFHWTLWFRNKNLLRKMWHWKWRNFIKCYCATTVHTMEELLIDDISDSHSKASWQQLVSWFYFKFQQKGMFFPLWCSLERGSMTAQ